tara:strand:- start:1002 stop:1202 length:201 start_codon:yes stop_codon:yes gene_type:complete
MDKKMPKLNFEKKSSSESFEIVVQVRDKNGNPTGRTKAYSGESSRDASDWYNKQKPTKKKKRKKKK